MGTLRTKAVTPLPSRLAVGGGSALFVDGRCSHPAGEPTRLAVLVGSEEVPALGWGLAPPRMHGDDYWWAILPISGEQAGQSVPISVRATAAGGTVEAPLGTIELVDRPAPSPPQAVPEGGEGPLVAICMGTYEPDAELFRAQVESIREQSHRNWVCLISDDGSSRAAVERIREAIGDDRRFALSTAGRNSGFYANFERALSLAPPAADLVALADQDDRWREHKLERLIAALEPDAGLVYSDMRITDRDGGVLADTYWGFRRNNYTDFGSLMVANTVTGAASLFRARLLSDILPFPPRHGRAFHDHWIAQVAMAVGPIGYVDEPLQDYVQHDEATLGYLQANGFGLYSAPLRERIATWYERWSGRGFRLGWRPPYFRVYCRVRLAATALRLRLGERLAPDRRAVLDALADDPPPLAWLARRGLRDLAGPTETIGRERVILSGLAWRVGTEMRKRGRVWRSRLFSRPR